MTLRSDLSRAGRWLTHFLALPILGAMVLSACFYLIWPKVEVDDGLEWVNHPLFRAGVAAFMLGAAVWISSQLSRVVAHAELDGTTLVLRGLLRRKPARESLCDLKAIHPFGVVEFASGRKVHLADHPAILQEISWWQAHGFRHAGR